jgi:hypothetical protein
MTVSARVMDAVEAGLSPTEGRTPKQVNVKVDEFSRDTIRHALRQLVEAGRATFDGPMGQRRYRREPYRHETETT